MAYSNPFDNPQTGFFGGGGGVGGGWNSFGGGAHPGYGGGGNHPPPGAPKPGVTPPVPTEGNNNPSPTGGGFPGGGDPNNFGQAMHPWDMPYGGQFTAPMSPYENNALQGFNDFVGGGMGLNQSGNYLNDVLGGKYLNLNSNPYLQQIQQGEQGIKDYNDKMALDKIGSSMALGGNALSGARLGATSDYMRNSNNAFESMMGQLMNQNYGMERNAMNQAPGMASNLANTAGGAYMQLFGMGATPRNLQQHDLDSQFNDFIRQTGALNHDSERPDNMLLQFLSTAGYKGQYQPTYGSSQGDILGNLAGQGGWGDILQQFFGGLTSGDQTQTQDQGTGVQFDGQVIGHDGPAAPAASGPANYYDRDWYQNALQQAKIKQVASMQKQNPNSNGAAIAALLMSILGGSGGGKKPKSGGAGMGGGPSLANNAGKAVGKGVGSLWESIFSKNPYPYDSPAGKAWREQFTYGSEPKFPAEEMGYSGDGSENMPGAIGYTPDNPLSGGGQTSFADYYNDLPYNFDNAGNGPNIGNFDPGFDFSGGGGGYEPSDVQF